MSQSNLEGNTSNLPGFYGKLPVLGDFVSRRLPHDFIIQWDSWLQSSFAVSRERLAERWLPCYLSSPIWRFGLSSGLCGQDSWVGIIMPSVDRVGRYFPLTMARKTSRNMSLERFFCQSSLWFDKAEHIALTALENDLSVETFDEMVRQIAEYDLSALSDFLPDLTKSFEELQFQAGVTTPVMDQNMLNGGVKGLSFWSTAGSASIQPGSCIFKGMPSFSQFSGFLTGQFYQQGWDLTQDHLYAADSQSPISVVQSPPQQQDLNQRKAGQKNAILSTPHQRATNTAWRSFSKTDRGHVRKLNEDSILDRPDLGLWVVADGMGGHHAGDVASQKIIHSLNNYFKASSLESAIGQFRQILNTVNAQLRELAENQIIGSTIVALLGGEQHFVCFWAGDSRLYRLRDNQLVQLTVDHCEPQHQGYTMTTNDKNSSLKVSNVITRAVGAFDELQMDSLFIEIQPGDIYLLSSDGLDKELEFNEIEKILQENIYSDSVELLLENVLSRKGRDNVSVIIVEVM